MRVAHPAAAVRPKPGKSLRPGSAGSQGRNGALEHFLASMRPHVALHWDANQQKLVPKPHQIGLPWRYLRPDCNGVADVLQVPADLFQLESLRGILTVEVWKECLSASERENLCYLLPEVTDQEGLVQSLLRGDIFHFGNPLADWSGLLLKGAMHPDVLQKWDSESTNLQREFYVERQNYHQKMLEKLRNLKECWVSCRNAGNEPSFKLKSCIKRKTVEKTMETNANVGNVSRQRCKRQKLGIQKEAIKKAACLSTDDVKLAKPKDIDGCKELIYTLRVRRKQYLNIKHREGKGEELLLASLSSILGDLQKIEIYRIDVANEKPAPKVVKFWSSLVENDIPSAHANFYTRKMHKERLARMAAARCMEKLSCFLHKEDKGEANNDTTTSTTFGGSATSQEKCRIVEHDPHFVAENSRKKLFSTSESSVTCNGSLLGIQATVDSSTSSVEVAQFSSQHLSPKLQASHNVKQDHAWLHFDHDAYLASGQSRGSFDSSIGEHEQNFVGELHCHVLREGEANLAESDNDVSNNNEISTIKNIWPGDDIDTEELQSRDEKKPDSLLSMEVSINWDPRLKLGSEDSTVLAGRAESEEVEQGIGIHLGAHCSGVDSQVLDMDLMSTFQNQTLKLSGNSFMFGHQDPASRYSDMKNGDDKKTHNELCRDEHHHDRYQYQETQAPSNELSHMTDGSLNHAVDHAHLFDSHLNGVFRTDNISPCNSIQSNKHDSSHSLVLSLRDYKCSGDKKDVKELRLLGDHRTTEKGDYASASPRSQHGLPGLNLGQATHMRTSCFGDQLKQRQPSLFSSQEECSPGNLLPGLPGWFNGWQMPSNKTQCFNSLLSLKNQWDVGQAGVQENWPYMGAFLDPFLSNNRIDASRNSCMLTNTYQQSQNSCLSKYRLARHEPNTRSFPNRSYSNTGGSQDNHGQILSPHAFRWTGDASRTASNEHWLNAPSESQQISLSEQKMLQEHLQRKATSPWLSLIGFMNSKRVCSSNLWWLLFIMSIEEELLQKEPMLEQIVFMEGQRHAFCISIWQGRLECWPFT